MGLGWGDTQGADAAGLPPACATGPGGAPLFMQNEPNYRHWGPENADRAEKQTQFKVNLATLGPARANGDWRVGLGRFGRFMEKRVEFGAHFGDDSTLLNEG